MATTDLERVTMLSAMLRLAYPHWSPMRCIECAAQCHRDSSRAVLEEVAVNRLADIIAQRPDYAPALDARRDRLREVARMMRELLSIEAGRE